MEQLGAGGAGPRVVQTLQEAALKLVGSHCWEATLVHRRPRLSACLSRYIHEHWRTREALFPEGGLNVLMGTIHADLWGRATG